MREIITQYVVFHHTAARDQSMTELVPPSEKAVTHVSTSQKNTIRHHSEAHLRRQPQNDHGCEGPSHKEIWKINVQTIATIHIAIINRRLFLSTTTTTTIGDDKSVGCPWKNSSTRNISFRSVWSSVQVYYQTQSNNQIEHTKTDDRTIHEMNRFILMFLFRISTRAILFLL